MSIDRATRQRLLTFQENEITECHIYSRLADVVKSPENSRILREIAADERRHYEQWREHTGEDVQPDRLKVWRYVTLSRVLGYTFGIKLMERGEEGAQINYRRVADDIPEADQIAQEETDHEDELIDMLDEERLRYTGSIVFGLNDALVELTGALAG